MAEENKLSSKLEKIAKEIEGLTAIELADLAKYMEDKFGVTSAPMVAGPAQAGEANAEGEAAQEEKTIFNVVLTEAGANKLAVIKAVREIDQNLGLMEAKKLVESAPKEVLKEAKKEQAEEAKKKLETAGAKVELK
ncbi:MAG: 50S ribosomal protein L7/L12 [bacterium]